MTTQHRRARGRETERCVTDYLASRIFPGAYQVGSGAGGADVRNTPGASIEVKARRDFDPMAWIREASRRPGLPLVVWRPDGMGPLSVADWPSMLPFGRQVDLMLAAGTGSASSSLDL